MHRIFCGDFLANTQMPSHIRKSYSGWSRAHLTISTEWVSSQTNESFLSKLISLFTVGFYGSLYDYIIYIALIAPLFVGLQVNLFSLTSATKFCKRVQSQLQKRQYFCFHHTLVCSIVRVYIHDSYTFPKSLPGSETNYIHWIAFFVSLLCMPMNNSVREVCSFWNCWLVVHDLQMYLLLAWMVLVITSHTPLGRGLGSTLHPLHTMNLVAMELTPAADTGRLSLSSL